MIGNTLVIGFGNKARQGKDYAARTIQTAYPGMVKLYSFAAALKSYARVVWGMREKNAPLLQDLGVLFRKYRGEDFWVDIVEATIREEEPEVAIITDVRYPNELAICDFFVKVQRLNADGTQMLAQDRPADHASETALDNTTPHAVLAVPNGKIDELRSRALELFNQLLVTHARQRAELLLAQARLQNVT